MNCCYSWCFIHAKVFDGDVIMLFFGFLVFSIIFFIIVFVFYMTLVLKVKFNIIMLIIVLLLMKEVLVLLEVWFM
jgi:hypothetical protein